MRREEKAILSFCCQVVTTKKFVFSPLGGLGPRSRCCQGCFLLSSLLAFTWIVCCTLLWPFLWAHTCSGVSSFYPNSSSLFRSWFHLIFNVQTGEICILKGAAVHSGLGSTCLNSQGPKCSQRNWNSYAGILWPLSQLSSRQQDKVNATEAVSCRGKWMGTVETKDCECRSQEFVEHVRMPRGLAQQRVLNEACSQDMCKGIQCRIWSKSPTSLVPDLW